VAVVRSGRRRTTRVWAATRSRTRCTATWAAHFLGSSALPKLIFSVATCRRVSPLDAFAGGDEIADPLYGNAGGAGEAAALRDTVRHLQLACAGLLNYLVELDARCALVWCRVSSENTGCTQMEHTVCHLRLACVGLLN